MPGTLADLKKLTAFCKKNGIYRIKTADFEFEIDKNSLSSPTKPTASTQPSTDLPQFPAWEALTPEEQVLWSAPIPEGTVNA